MGHAIGNEADGPEPDGGDDGRMHLRSVLGRGWGRRVAGQFGLVLTAIVASILFLGGSLMAAEAPDLTGVYSQGFPNQPYDLVYVVQRGDELIMWPVDIEAARKDRYASHIKQVYRGKYTQDGKFVLFAYLGPRSTSFFLKGNTLSTETGSLTWNLHPKLVSSLRGIPIVRIDIDPRWFSHDPRGRLIIRTAIQKVWFIPPDRRDYRSSYCPPGDRYLY